MALRHALFRGNPSDGSIPGPLPHARGGACNRMVDVGRNRSSRRKLGATFQARPIPRRFRLGSSFEERAVFALGHLRPAYAHATVNSRRGNADEKQAVEMRIPRQKGLITYVLAGKIAPREKSEIDLAFNDFVLVCFSHAAVGLFTVAHMPDRRTFHLRLFLTQAMKPQRGRQNQPFSDMKTR